MNDLYSIASQTSATFAWRYLVVSLPAPLVRLLDSPVLDVRADELTWEDPLKRCARARCCSSRRCRAAATLSFLLSVAASPPLLLLLVAAVADAASDFVPAFALPVFDFADCFSPLPGVFSVGKSNCIPPLGLDLAPGFLALESPPLLLLLELLELLLLPASKLVPLRPFDCALPESPSVFGTPSERFPIIVEGCGVFLRFNLEGLGRPAQSVFAVATSTSTAAVPPPRGAIVGFFRLAAAVVLLRALASCPAPRDASIKRSSSEEADTDLDRLAMGDKFPTGPSRDSRAINELIMS